MYVPVEPSLSATAAMEQPWQFKFWDISNKFLSVANKVLIATPQNSNSPGNSRISYILLEYLSSSISQIIDGTSLMVVIIVVTRFILIQRTIITMMELSGFVVQQWVSKNLKPWFQDLPWMAHSLIFHPQHDIVGHPFILGTCLSANLIPALYSRFQEYKK